MKFICTLITVTDINRSKHFYEHLLGQRVINDFGENVGFEGGFAIHLRSHFEGVLHHKAIVPGVNNMELYFEHDELEPLVEKLKENGVEFVHEIETQPWQQKVMRFYDPDGYMIEVGESMQHLCQRLHADGMSEAEISKATSLPIEYVKMLLTEGK